MAKDSHTRFVSPAALDRIEQWSRRKPIFALMGEFSAGKSTLINFLLRTQALPTQVTATQLPPVWFSWGNRSAYVKRHDGSTEDITLDQLEQVGVNDAQFVRIFLKADILEAVDLIDTPGISDPKISTDVWQRAVGQANGVLWCTHSTQAWRETERATWVALPERLQANSLLLITRADALGQKDRQKVLRRVNREAGHLFNRSILFSARDAIEARDKTGDAELWARSGGGKMVDSFLEITEQIMASRKDQLARYQVDRAMSGGPKILPKRVKSKTETAQPSPLQLVNPVDDNADDVVTNFPIRPTRVERNQDEIERPRIEAEEADRLRTEMTPEADNSEDELRAFFRDTSEETLDITAVPNAQEQSGDIDFDELAEGDADEAELIVLGVDEDTPNDEALDIFAEDNSAAGNIGDSVSSIAALLSEQSDGSDDEYEPEPESNALTAASVVTFDGAEDADTAGEDDGDLSASTLEHLLNVPAGSLLSASDLWHEIVSTEDLPNDATGLKNAFVAFLNEFDQIALEHSARANKETMRPFPNANKNGGAERHVL